MYRKQVLEELDRLVKDFVVRVGKAKGLPDPLATDAGGKIFTFGSYRLGVHSAGTIAITHAYYHYAHYNLLLSFYRLVLTLSSFHSSRL